ncbi:MAG: hypothetical protein HYT34_00015 [Candidatus Ryanbacteria bacterium]|nr:hypothetical protein [Candidatus Ryanbacteria bacterium]
MKIKKLLKDFHITFASIITTFFVATVLFTFAAWQNPTQAPPGGNVDAPINIGPTAQTKTGGGITLDLQATNNPALTVTSNGLNWGSGIQFRNTSGGGINYGIYSGPDAQLHIREVTASVDRLAISPTQVMVFDGGGTNVGLRVTGRIRTGDAANQGAVWVDSAQTMFVGAVDANNIGFFGNGAGVGFGLSMNKTTGNVGIGEAPGTYKLLVNGTLRANYLRAKPQTTGGEGGEILLEGSGSFGSSYLDNVNGALRVHNGSITLMSVSPTGDLTPGRLCLSGDCRSAWPTPPSVINTSENVRIVRGNILGTGGSFGGAGFICSVTCRTSQGSYVVVFAPGFSNIPAVVATVAGIGNANITIAAGLNSFTATVRDSSGNLADRDFYFIAIGSQ